MNTALIEPAETAAPNEVSWIRSVFKKHIAEYLPTFATEFTVLLSQILAYKLASHYLGKTGFSEYAVVRRLVSLIAPISLLGVGVGLPRYIAYSKGNNDENAAARYYRAALICVVAASLLCILLMNLLDGHFAFVFFGSKAYAYLVFPLSTMILGLCLHTVACGYFRGNMELSHANALQFVNLSLIPLLAFFFDHKDLMHVLLVVGTAWTLIAGVTLGSLAFPLHSDRVSREAKDLLSYGIQRVPGDFILMALFTLPITVVAHISGMEQAGYVAFAVAVLSMIGAIFAPVGLVLLPKATHMFAEGAGHELRLHVAQILKLSMLVCLFLTIVVAVFANPLIRLYLGTGYEPVANLVRVVVIGALPYTFYLVLRNIIDAFHKHGVTALILLGGLVVFGFAILALSFLSSVGSSVVPAFLVGLFTLAIASGWESKRILERDATRVV